jgi:signal transduction histidine kinase
MNQHLQSILDFIQHSETLGPEVKNALLNSLNAVDKEMEIISFKLDRTEKVKRTTAILLEETIEELEHKRKAVEETNVALEKSLLELKATQAQLIQSEKMASLGELTAGIAHEIQNPLNFVNNFAEVTAELVDEMIQNLAAGSWQSAVELADDLKQNLDKINHHGKRAGDIVRGMLQHSRTSTGQKEPTDINALADEYLRLAYHGLRAKDKSFNADFKTDLDPDLPDINVIPQDIGRVLLNLINNAFYAVSKRNLSALPNLTGLEYRPTVTVTTRKKGEKVEISVKDNGPGIPDEIKEKIFQPFFTTKPTGQGTGLGLSLSYDIVKAHAGEISVKTQEGIGTEFIIDLPTSA